MNLLNLACAFISGAALASAVWMWRVQMPPDKLELMHQNVALSHLAGEAIARLDSAEREDVQEVVTEMMEESFGEGAGVEVEEIAEEAHD